MTIFKGCLPIEDGYYWYRIPGAPSATICRISTPKESADEVPADDEDEGFEQSKTVWFLGAEDEIWSWELAEIYELAGPIFPPSDWPLDLTRWPL